MIIVVPLLKGITIGETVYKQAKVREANLLDCMSAEAIADPSSYFKLNAELLCVCITELAVDDKEGAATTKGPFVSNFFHSMTRNDFNLLVNGMVKAELEGNAPQGTDSISSAAP